MILISLDDSLGTKGKSTRHLQAVYYHHNHIGSSGRKQVYINGHVDVEVHVQIGPIGFFFDTRLHPREKKVRQPNREREAGQGLHDRGMYYLACSILEAPA